MVPQRPLNTRLHQLLRIFRCILKFLQIAGLTNIAYDNEKQAFVVLTGRNWYLRLMLGYNTVTPLAYLVVRLLSERFNMSLNELQPGARRAFNQMKCINDFGNALAFLIFAWKFHGQQRQLVHSCNEALKAVKCIQRTASSKFSCSLALLLAMYVVITKIVLALAWSVYNIQLDSMGLPDCVSSLPEYVASFALLVCSLSFHLQLLLYSSHYVLLVCLYASYNRYMETLKQTAKAIKALGKILAQHAALEQLHGTAFQYFSRYCWFMLLKTYFDYRQYVRQFSYDEVSLWHPVDEDLEELEVVCTETAKRDELIWKAAMQLLWCLSTFISLLFVAYAYQRERLFFNSNILHLAEYPEYFAHLAPIHSELATHSQALPQYAASSEDAVQRQLPKYSIIDFLLDNGNDVGTLALSNIILLKFWGLKLPLRHGISSYKQLTIATILIMVLDLNHFNEMQLLNELVKNDLI